MSAENNTKHRITVLRELLDLSQREFAESVGITQGALSQLEAGKSKLSLDSITKISNTFNVNCNWLIHGQREVFIKPPPAEMNHVRHSYITRDPLDGTLIPLIKEEAHAGYIKGCNDPTFLETLDVYKIPGFESGNYRLFEIMGDSMVPAIHPRETVVCEQVESPSTIENGTLCIVIAESGIVAKRIYYYDDDHSILILKSDNAKYKTYSILLDEVIEVWEVKAKITNVFTSNQVVDAKKIENLESDISELKEQVLKLSQQNLSDSGRADSNQS